MSYKFIAVDVDGTLLNDNLEITKQNALSINKAIEEGVVFSISTGRPIQGVEKFKEIINLKHPVITYNGAMVVDPLTNEILFEKNLLPKDARVILELGNALRTTMCIWAGNLLYTNVLSDNVEQYKKMAGIEPIYVTDYEKLLEMGISKILWFDDVSKIGEYQKILKEYTFDKVTHCTSKPYFLEFFNCEVSKATAIEFICNMYGIKREETIAIGDGENDIAMIEYAGLGVAMENACDEIKSKAKYITLSNNNDGIAHVIEKFVL